MTSSSYRYGVNLELPSRDELQQIEQIRIAAKDEIAKLKDPASDVVGDIRIVRFLRAKKGMKEAIKWYKEFLAWRTVEQVPGGTVEDWRKEVVGRSPNDFMEWRRPRSNVYMPCNYDVGFNPDGHLLFVAQAGHWDFFQWAERRPKDFTMDDEAKLNIQTSEWFHWIVDTNSRQSGSMKYIIQLFDLAGMGENGRSTPLFADKRWSNFMSKRLQPIFTNYYCYLDAAIVAINCPKSISRIWSVAKHLVTEQQRNKIMFLGDARRAEVQQQFVMIWPRDFLPQEYGGTLAELKDVWPPASSEDAQHVFAERGQLKVEYPETSGRKPYDVASVINKSLTHGRSENKLMEDAKATASEETVEEPAVSDTNLPADVKHWLEEPLDEKICSTFDNTPEPVINIITMVSGVLEESPRVLPPTPSAKRTIEQQPDVSLFGCCKPRPNTNEEFSVGAGS